MFQFHYKLNNLILVKSQIFLVLNPGTTNAENKSSINQTLSLKSNTKKENIL